MFPETHNVFAVVVFFFLQVQCSTFYSLQFTLFSLFLLMTIIMAFSCVTTIRLLKWALLDTIGIGNLYWCLFYLLLFFFNT